MPRPKQVTDDQLMLAARKVFLKQGVNAPVAAVAREVGVTPAALFHRMKSKEHLFCLSLWPADPPELALLEAGPRAGEVREQLMAILVGLAEYLSQAVPAMFLLHAGGVRPPRNFVTSAPIVRLRTGLTKWLEYAASRRNIKIRNAGVVAEALLGALEARCLRRYLLAEKFTPAEDHAFVRELVTELTR